MASLSPPPDDTAIPVIILGTGITALGVQRVCARSGLTSVLAETNDPLTRRSRWYRPLTMRLPSEGRYDLASWLPEVPFARAVLISCSDHWARAVATMDPSLRERFPASTSAPDVLRTLVDKGYFAEAVERLGVPHPTTRLVRSANDLDGMSDQELAEAFLKPRDSARFFATFGTKGIRVGSRKEGRDRLEQIFDAGHELVVQDYIPGPAGNHYFIDGFMDRHRTIRALFARRRLRMYPSDFGNSTFMKSVPIQEVDDAAQSLVRLLQGVGYRGIFSAEFKLDPRDGRFKILEVNARAWWYVEYAARCGVDVCAMAYRDALHLDVATVESYRVGREFVYPYHDYFACRELREKGELTLYEWGRSWIGSAQPVFQPADPWPALAGSAEVLFGKVKNALRSRGQA